MYVDKGTHGRGRCPNCRKNYQKRAKNQKFCRLQCKTEWHAAGGTPFDKLTRHIEARISKEVAKQLKASRPKIVDEIISRLNSPHIPATLRASLEALRAEINKLP